MFRYNEYGVLGLPTQQFPVRKLYTGIYYIPAYLSPYDIIDYRFVALIRQILLNVVM